MISEHFKQIFDAICVNSHDILIKKAEEYATEDRLHNFKTAAHIQGITPLQALAGMMAKHTVSVYDMLKSDKCYPEEMWSEKIIDSINYLILAYALAEDEHKMIYPDS